MKGWHIWACVALVTAGAILVATGAGAVAIIPVLGCAAMMGAMVWMMMRGGGRGGGTDG